MVQVVDTECENGGGDCVGIEPVRPGALLFASRQEPGKDGLGRYPQRGGAVERRFDAPFAGTLLPGPVGNPVDQVAAVLLPLA